jgi:methylthioribose-1-phosphate isomerase
MKVDGTHYRTIWPDPEDISKVIIIDQRELPHRFVTASLSSVEDAYHAIKNMLVRGAGLIGATAGYGMYLAALGARDKHFHDDLRESADLLKKARPTASNLAWAADRMLARMLEAEGPEIARKTGFHTACLIADEDVRFCKKIGEHGRSLIEEIWVKKDRKRVNILTHCNAGWLAFVDYGSATAPIYAARDTDIDVHVWVDETRPWNQGARLTCWELQQEGIDNTLITDNAGGHLMQEGLVDMVIVGTDRTTHTGDVANKIGTYLKALAAHDNNIPFYVALPSSTFDWKITAGREIPIEERSPDEITNVAGISENGTIELVRITADNTRAVNYSFDITPARYVSALITERGIVKAEKTAIHAMFPDHVSSPGQPHGQGDYMPHGEKRKFDRWDSLHLLNYIVLNEDGTRGHYSMARTLDVSLNGIRMETVELLSSEAMIEVTLGVEEDLIDLVGRVTFCKPEGERFVSGVEFIKMSAEGRKAFRRYADAFKGQTGQEDKGE